MEPTDTNLVDLIQTADTTVTTVAEAKAKKTVRQTNLTTVVNQLADFNVSDVLSYPITTIIELQTQAKRISLAYKTMVNQLEDV